MDLIDLIVVLASLCIFGIAIRVKVEAYKDTKTATLRQVVNTTRKLRHKALEDKYLKAHTEHRINILIEGTWIFMEFINENRFKEFTDFITNGEVYRVDTSWYYQGVSGKHYKSRISLLESKDCTKRNYHVNLDLYYQGFWRAYGKSQEGFRPDYTTIAREPSIQSYYKASPYPDYVLKTLKGPTNSKQVIITIASRYATVVRECTNELVECLQQTLSYEQGHMELAEEQDKIMYKRTIEEITQALDRIKGNER